MPIHHLANEFPELRIHMAHLRALHQQRLIGTEQHLLPSLRTEQPPKGNLIQVTLNLSPEVVDAFKAAGKGWRTQINEVLMALVGGESQ